MKKEAKSVYQLKISLQGIVPQIWRRVMVPADIRLSELSVVVEAAMGWMGGHMHAFRIGAIEYTDPVFEVEGVDERKVRLSKVVTDVKDRFTYEYDFGDDWQHTLVLEKILPADPAVKYPICVAGKRACPPEDCGGVWGYYAMLEALADPKHPEHEEMMEWTDGGFDPEEFNLELANAMVQRLKF